MRKESFLAAAEKFGTPLYLYDLEEIEKRVDIVKNALSGIENDIFFALKANSNIHLMRFMKELGLGVDAVSMNEYKMARYAGFEPERIVVNGNGKTRDELEFYINEGVNSINVDSQNEIERFPGKNCGISIRINPDVDARTHPHISTGLKENKFGVDLKTAAEMIKNLPDAVKLAGLHCHIGSQITKIEPFEEAFRSIRDFIEKEDLHLEFMNIGGGWGIDYAHDGTGLDVALYREKILPILKSFGTKIHLELGRFLIGRAGYLLTKVMEVKETSHKRFVVVDSSMSDLIRPSLYGAYHRIEFLSDGPETVADIVGRVCESGDSFGKSRSISLPKPGDLGIVYDVGTYGYSMASNYNLSLRPAEVSFDGNGFRPIRKRETFEDLLKGF